MEGLDILLQQLFGEDLQGLLDIEEPMIVLSDGKRRRIFTSCCTSSYASYSS